MAVRLLGCGNGDENDLRIVHPVFDAAGETQPFRGDIAMDHFLQARLVDWNHPGLQRLDFARVVIHANDVVPDVRETGPGYKANIS